MRTSVIHAAAIMVVVGGLAPKPAFAGDKEKDLLKLAAGMALLGAMANAQQQQQYQQPYPPQPDTTQQAWCPNHGYNCPDATHQQQDASGPYSNASRIATPVPTGIIPSAAEGFVMPPELSASEMPWLYFAESDVGRVTPQMLQGRLRRFDSRTTVEAQPGGAESFTITIGLQRLSVSGATLSVGSSTLALPSRVQREGDELTFSTATANLLLRVCMRPQPAEQANR